MLLSRDRGPGTRGDVPLGGDCRTLRPYGYPWEAVALITLDLHPIFRNNRDLDVALRQALFRAAATGVDVLQVIAGKGTGALRQRVLTTLAQAHLRKLYARVEVDPDNPGRILVHLR